MQTPNAHGVYKIEIVEEVARSGRASVAVQACQCEDGLYRFALVIAYPTGGSAEPIRAETAGFATFEAAKAAATEKALRICLSHQPSQYPDSDHAVRALGAELRQRLAQLSLFDLVT